MTDDTPKTIDLTPCWAGLASSLIALIESGNQEGRGAAITEIHRMAAADKAVADADLHEDDEISHVKAVEFANTVAMMLLDDEQTKERQVEGLGSFDMGAQDAWETMESLITRARDLTGNKPFLIDPA